MKKSDLLVALDRVIPFSATRAIAEEFTAVNIKNGTIQASDGYKGISMALKLESDVEGLVPAEILHKLIKSIKTQDIRFVQKGSAIRVKAKNVAAEINCLQDIDFPDLETDIKKPKTLPPNFVEALQVCRFAASADLALGCRIGIIFHGRYAFAIDRFNVMRVDLGEESKDVFVITTDLANELYRLREDLSNYTLKSSSAGESRALFTVGNNATVFGNLLQYDLQQNPDETLSTFSDKKAVSLGKLPTSMLETLSRHEIILEGVPEIDKRIKLEFSAGSLLIRSVSERGKVLEKMKLDKANKKNEISFQINPLLLKDVLVYNPEVRVYRDPLMMEFSSKNFNYYVMGEI